MGNWARFLKLTLGLALGLAGLLYGLILLVDPYDTVWFSALHSGPIASNQRYSYPAIARDPQFDSAVLGTSTARLFEPRGLDAALGGRFVNLAMNSATAYEQARILEVFLRAHPAPRTVLFGLDAVWCVTGEHYVRLTTRSFPEWMYDDDPWNDLWHLFNLQALEDLGREVGYHLGFRPLRYGSDGYRNFLPDESEYDLARARTHLYAAKPPAPAAPDHIARLRAEWNYPTHPVLAGMLDSLPAATTKILVLPPLHRSHVGAPETVNGAHWDECKARLAALTSGQPNAHLLDFMIASAITTRDENYWDALHYKVSVAGDLVRFIADGVRRRTSLPDAYDYLKGAPD